MQTRINILDIYTLYDPSKCERSVFLRINRKTRSKPSDFDTPTKIPNEQYKLEHLLQFDKYADLSRWNLEDKVRKTIRAVIEGFPVIYQGAFIAKLPSGDIEVIGTPDFLIKDNGSYRIRECSLSSNVDESHRSGIIYQLELYGWLFENTFKFKPSMLEIYLGDKTIKEFEYSGDALVLKEFDKIISILSLKEEQYKLSQSSGSDFIESCLNKAEEI